MLETADTDGETVKTGITGVYDNASNLFERIFLSDQFTFYIGRKKNPIVVHAAAIETQSKALHVLMNGGLSESHTRSANFDDVFEEDFIRFCQFAYTGDYTVPPPTKDGNAQSNLGWSQGPSVAGLDDECEESAPPDAIPINDSWCGFERGKKKEKMLSKKARFQQAFENRVACETLPRQAIYETCKPAANKKACEDYTDVFLAHARLYVFADKYGIESLKALTLSKLHTTLVSFTLYEPRIKDIMELAKYAYDNTPCLSSPADELRALVRDYLVYKFDRLGASEPFIGLMEAGGALVRDIFVVLQKIS